MLWRCALSRIGFFGRVKNERRARGCWRGENSREEGKDKKNEEWEEVCDGGHGALRSIIRGLVCIAWSPSWPPATKLMNPEAGASAKIEDKLRSGIKHTTFTYIKINHIKMHTLVENSPNVPVPMLPAKNRLNSSSGDISPSNIGPLAPPGDLAKSLKGDDALAPADPEDPNLLSGSPPKRSNFAFFSESERT